MCPCFSPPETRTQYLDQAVAPQVNEIVIHKSAGSCLGAGLTEGWGDNVTKSAVWPRPLFAKVLSVRYITTLLGAPKCILGLL